MRYLTEDACAWRSERLSLFCPVHAAGGRASGLRLRGSEECRSHVLHELRAAAAVHGAGGSWGHSVCGWRPAWRREVGDQMSAFCSVMLKDFKKCFYEMSEELRTACWPPWWVNNTVLLLKGPPPPRTTTAMFVCQWVQPGAVDVCWLWWCVCVCWCSTTLCRCVFTVCVGVSVFKPDVESACSLCVCVCQCVQPGVAGAYSLC